VKIEFAQHEQYPCWFVVLVLWCLTPL